MLPSADHGKERTWTQERGKEETRRRLAIDRNSTNVIRVKSAGACVRSPTQRRTKGKLAVNLKGEEKIFMIQLRKGKGFQRTKS